MKKERTSWYFLEFASNYWEYINVLDLKDTDMNNGKN